jgi:hypothetical protein
MGDLMCDAIVAYRNNGTAKNTDGALINAGGIRYVSVGMYDSQTTD